MPKPLEKFAKYIAEKIYKHFGDSSGGMILATSITGTLLSSLAQTGAILFNDKYTTSQKTFMAPQELTEGLINVLSMFLITKPIQRGASKMVKTGKILSKDLGKYLQETKLDKKRGDINFDIGKAIRNNIKSLESNDSFFSSASKAQNLEKHREALHNFEIFSDSVSAYATTGGAILSTAFIAPVLRNSAAANYQKASIDALQNNRERRVLRPRPNSNFSKEGMVNNLSVFRV
ncbi:MAG: hypothetical protein E7Z89_05505 [Cyanobacteria bacterium SIG28]|nr:hypothetical protein [Cyanobacteria bacterium SIG28]